LTDIQAILPKSEKCATLETRSRVLVLTERSAMDMTILTIIGGILAVGSIICIAVLLALLLSGRRQRAPDREADICPRCHQPLPRGTTTCPTCRETPPEPPSPATTSGRPGPALIGLSGSLAREVFPIHPAPKGLTIGRNPDNDVAISDMLAVSRYHAQVIP
jgi:hypothetical protein